jgi:hypothetical protein
MIRGWHYVAARECFIHVVVLVPDEVALGLDRFELDLVHLGDDPRRPAWNDEDSSSRRLIAVQGLMMLI